MKYFLKGLFKGIILLLATPLVILLMLIDDVRYVGSDDTHLDGYTSKFVEWWNKL